MLLFSGEVFNIFAIVNGPFFSQQKPEASEHFRVLKAASAFPGICAVTFKVRLYLNNTIHRAKLVLNLPFGIVIYNPFPVDNELILILTWS
jgi:hypothetical protein